MATNRVKGGKTGDVLVFFPFACFMVTTVYFTCLTGEIKLSDVFPWLFWFFFPGVLIMLFFAVISLLHLFSRESADRARGKVLWVLFFILAPALALPLYRFTRMRATLCHGPP